LKKLVGDGILRKDKDKRYSLANRGKTAIHHMQMLEKEIVGDIPNNVILILSSKIR